MKAFLKIGPADFIRDESLRLGEQADKTIIVVSPIWSGSALNKDGTPIEV